MIEKMTQTQALYIAAACGVLVVLIGSFVYSNRAELFSEETALKSPLLSRINSDIQEEPELPLLQFSIKRLQEYSFTPSTLQLLEKTEETTEYQRYTFAYTSTQRTITGQLTVPTEVRNDTQEHHAIVMLRGYVPQSIYDHGVGTRNAAAAYAQAGFVTIAPDFLGYGQSDPEPEDSWESRFIKPIHVIELMKGIQESGVPIDLDDAETVIEVESLGLWGHSNGGQIALSVLEILEEPIPTTLWAPVTAPFPYSILFFSDEHDDEGKGMRTYLTQFEQLYDVFDFSVTQHLESLRGPILIHHGTSDEAALVQWSQEFMSKISAENERRAARALQQKQIIASSTASEAASAIEIPQASESARKVLDEHTEPIDITLLTYPGANHNLQPSWDTVVTRDITFFDQNLRQ